jgi:hypothetical protein
MFLHPNKKPCYLSATTLKNNTAKAINAFRFIAVVVAKTKSTLATTLYQRIKSGGESRLFVT